MINQNNIQMINQNNTRAKIKEIQSNPNINSDEKCKLVQNIMYTNNLKILSNSSNNLSKNKG